ncbi:MAG: glycine--tRNA ligase subunit beta, partial [Cyanobacteria bacterium J06598_4]
KGRLAIATSRNKIEAGILAEAESIDGQAEIYPDLLAEVIDLVEYPTAVTGKFAADFLKLPTEVITTVMVSHQRYFPVHQKGNGGLLPNFITISNGDPQKKDVIAEGNGRVIRARLADAQFFYQADCDEHLDTYLPELENVTFQEDLGSMREKVDRIIDTAKTIAEQLDLNEAQQNEIESTALLCKADLVTQMVYEFPELQGIMGEKYAVVSGESPAVAKGIFEHYLPRGADDIMPSTLNGQVVGLADRLDTLVGIFGLGMIPTGSSDPFALRRAANGVVNITWSADLPLNLDRILEQSAADFVSAGSDRQSPL